MKRHMLIGIYEMAHADIYKKPQKILSGNNNLSYYIMFAH